MSRSVFHRWHHAIGAANSSRIWEPVDLESRIVAGTVAEPSGKISTDHHRAVCWVGMGATSVVKESVEITNGGFGRPLKVVLVNGTSSGSPYYKVE